MLSLAYYALLFALLVSLLGAAQSVYTLFTGARANSKWPELAHYLTTGLLVVCSTVLTIALVNRNYSFKYVADYTNDVLPLFYAITAFWAGQAGSLLFWELLIALCAVIFPFTRSYKSLPERTRSAYWAFFLIIQGFFLLLLTNWSNPFLEYVPPPADGRGLNPLLQNPGMIFHPPLLFIGYAAFTVPACLALAFAVVRTEGMSWISMTRNFSLTAWIFLTAGIVLGGWWSYMELGWGGYWAWDPVENASLIPWFSGTAFLHTAYLEQRRGVLKRANVFLIALTVLMCLFATYLVRSGVIDSLHAFGDGGVGGPLLTSILGGAALVLVAAFGVMERPERRLSGLLSRDGLVVVASWVFLGLGLVVMLGTMWPVISSIWSENPEGLKPGFYNTVCLPLFSAILLIFLACPWLGFKSGRIRDKRGLYGTLGVFVGAAVLIAALGYTQPLALVTSAAAIAAVASIVMLYVFQPSVRNRRAVGAYAIHLGVALMFLGVAFSGPYQASKEAVVAPNEPVELGGYVFTLRNIEEIETPGIFRARATIEVNSEEGERIGTLHPERRLYRNFQQPFAEVSVIPSLGKELYAVLLGYTETGTASIKVAISPLINWIWIGAVISCLLGFLGLGSTGRAARREEG